MEVLPPIFRFAWRKNNTKRDAWCKWKAARDKPPYSHPSASCTSLATLSPLALTGIKNYSIKMRRRDWRSKNWKHTRNMCTPLRRKIVLPLHPRKLLIADVTRLQPYIVGGDSFREHVEALISYNLRNDGYQQDSIYIEQGHLMTPTTFMTHSMAIDPRRAVVVTWTPIPLCIQRAGSQHWCPRPSLSSTSPSNWLHTV